MIVSPRPVDYKLKIRLSMTEILQIHNPNLDGFSPRFRLVNSPWKIPHITEDISVGVKVFLPPPFIVLFQNA
jgi:hypothetical protein